MIELNPPRNLSLLRPESEAPLDTWLLVLHKHLGLVEAKKDSDMVQDHSDYCWDSEASEYWLYSKDILGWMSHPLSGEEKE